MKTSELLKKMNFSKYRMRQGTLLEVKNSKRSPWKLMQYLTDDIIVLEAEDGKQIQINKNQAFTRYKSK